MLINKKIVLSILSIILFWGCSHSLINNSINTVSLNNKTTVVQTGLDVLLDKHLDKLFGKNIALVTNHSGLNKDGESNVSLFLSNDNIRLIKIFTPEHGFTGNLPAGEKVEYDSSFSNLPMVLSLYGNTRKPTVEMLDNIDIIIYDIQDVGARFYTYVSTLGLVMEAAAEQNIPVMVLDRPNPISNKTGGPILDMEYKSFIGMYPIPTQYGMTIGELAQMIVGEKLIGIIPELTVVQMEGYTNTNYFDETFLPWTKPSPNIPDLETSIVYPGFCLFEATNVSEGRGTYSPFKQIGAPWIDANKFAELMNNQNLSGVEFKPIEFIPISIPSMSKYPKHENEKCYGIEINITNRKNFESILTGVTTLWAINKFYPDSLVIKKDSMGRIWGSDNLYDKLIKGKNPEQIIESYRNELNKFLQVQDKYLIYN